MTEPTLNIRDLPNLAQFAREPDTTFFAYLMAYRYRRGRARNEATKFGVGTLAEPPYLSGPDRDLYERYQTLINLMELDRKSSKLYEALIDKRLQAELLIKNLREPERLDYDQRRKLLLELNELEDDIQRLAGLLEDLDNA